MPHIVMEFGGLDQPLAPLMEALADAVATHPEVPRSAVKVRAHECTGFLLLSGEPRFVNVTLRLMDSRPDAQHAELADILMAELTRLLPADCAIGVDTARIPKLSFRKR